MSPTCANCGALLPPAAPGAYHVRCAYCHLDQGVAAPPPPVRVVVVPQAPSPPSVLVPSRPVGGVVALALTLAVLGGAVPIFLASGAVPFFLGSGTVGSLGRGAPLGLLAKVDPAIDIDRSHDALAKIFPGVTSKPFIDLDHTVAVDHPWYGEAELSWKNRAGSHLATVLLRPPGGTGKLGNQREVEACIERSLGKPTRRSEADHLHGTWDTTWQPAGGGEVRVYPHMVSVQLSDSPFCKDMPRATWTRVVAMLDACGRR